MPNAAERLRVLTACASFSLVAITAGAQQPAAIPIVLHAARLLQVDTGA
jgi:L-fucose isomerase-like protein